MGKGKGKVHPNNALTRPWVFLCCHKKILRKIILKGVLFHSLRNTTCFMARKPIMPSLLLSDTLLLVLLCCMCTLIDTNAVSVQRKLRHYSN